MGVRGKIAKMKKYIGLQKANFTFFNVAKGEYDLNSAKSYGVLINPSEISKSYYCKLQRSTGIQTDEAIEEDVNNMLPTYLKSIEIPTVRLNMNLIFDLVDKSDSIPSRIKATHKGRSRGKGAKAGLKSVKAGLFQSDATSETSINIHNLPIYKEMVNCQKGPAKYVIFNWGDIAFAGFIERFNPSFTYFSDKGAPLRMELNVSILEAYLEAVEREVRDTSKNNGMPGMSKAEYEKYFEPVPLNEAIVNAEIQI